MVASSVAQDANRPRLFRAGSWNSFCSLNFMLAFGIRKSGRRWHMLPVSCVPSIDGMHGTKRKILQSWSNDPQRYQTINIMYSLININAYKRIEFPWPSSVIITQTYYYYCDCRAHYCARNFLILGDALEWHLKRIHSRASETRSWQWSSCPASSLHMCKCMSAGVSWS